MVCIFFFLAALVNREGKTTFSTSFLLLHSYIFSSSSSFNLLLHFYLYTAANLVSCATAFIRFDLNAAILLTYYTIIATTRFVRYIVERHALDTLYLEHHCNGFGKKKLSLYNNWVGEVGAKDFVKHLRKPFDTCWVVGDTIF